MLVGEIMTREVVSIDSNDSVLNACFKYRDKKIGCLIVTENDQCVGILTERDIIVRSVCQVKDPKKTKVKEIMSSDIKSIHPLDKIEKAIEKMQKYKIKKLPVISDNSLVGIITIADIGRSKPELTERFMESWIKPRWID
jgi:CBS domain-containing protein